MIAKSQVKLDELKRSQQTEMQQYADTEQLAVDEKKKRLHYERIRISEDRDEIRRHKQELDKLEQDIEERVYQDTKEVQSEKHRIDNLVDDLAT